jgi:hypothetical protein
MYHDDSSVNATKKDPSAMQVTTVGLDLSKCVFQIYGSTALGQLGVRCGNSTLAAPPGERLSLTRTGLQVLRHSARRALTANCPTTADANGSDRQ